MWLVLLACAPSDPPAVLSSLLAQSDGAALVANGSARFGASEPYDGTESFWLRSSDPDVVSLAEAEVLLSPHETEEGELWLESIDVHTGLPGATLLELVDEGGSVVAQQELVVAEPSSAALVPDAWRGTELEGPLQVVAGGFAFLHVEAFDADGSRMEGARGDPWCSTLLVWDGDSECQGSASAGGTVVVGGEEDVLVPDGLGGTFEVRVVGTDAVRSLEVIEVDEGLQAVARDAAGVPVLGVMPTWSGAPAEPSSGDQYRYAPDPFAPPVAYDVVWEGFHVEGAVQQAEPGAVGRSDDPIGCSTVPRGASWLFALGALGVVLRRRG